jgi:phosphopantothenoylcysteine decarboxylase/phosphopantothenate--cysteine ligase
VRYLSNHSSGKQGYAIAGALADLGADVTLVSGPVSIRPPSNVKLVKVETALEMLAACEAALPADVFVSVAAVADWRPASCGDKKIKKNGDAPAPLELEENPDILKTLSTAKNRPNLVVGFAAETNDVIKHATAKRLRKTCDWIVANDVSGDVMGGDHNKMILVTDEGADEWPRLTKADSAKRLAAKIAEHFA